MHVLITAPPPLSPQVTLLSLARAPPSEPLASIAESVPTRVLPPGTPIGWDAGAAGIAGGGGGGGRGGGGGGGGGGGSADSGGGGGGRGGEGGPPVVAHEYCEAQARLRAAAPHVLLEGMGYLPGQQLALLARPCTRAPVQTSWLRNFQGSMEASFVNYGMADARALPPKTARLSAERATLLPHQLLVNSHAYHIRQSQARESTLHSSQLVSPSSSPRQRRSALRTARGSSDGFTPALRTARPLLCSLNRVNKLDPTVFDSWASALLRARVPLWVATGAGERTPSSRPASLHAGAHHGANPPLSR